MSCSQFVAENAVIALKHAVHKELWAGDTLLPDLQCNKPVMI